jgi:tetratricopeptide (TPR) repeat protein
MPKSAPASSSKVGQARWPALLLFFVALALYWPVRNFDFLNFDDPDYVTANPHISRGLTPETLQWALTSGEAANWCPVTRISHLIDAQFFGLDPGWHHFINALLHALAAVLLFAFLHRATAALWPSVFVAFVFALHPLHTESVAWVSERKDVLSVFFCFLTLWAWVRSRRLLALVAFALGLMSKPMLVTLPFVLLLLDYWPLRRGLRFREKVPFFALSAVAASATFLVQRDSGAVQTVAALPVGLRIENALVTYITYIAKTFWPSGLAVFYPYPATLPLWRAALALLALAAVSVLVWRTRRTRPWLAVGWFWFLGTLVPVIGLIQVGAQARADRYMYIPSVGLTIMLAWTVPELPMPRNVLRALAVIACLALAAATWAQLQYWHDSEAIFRHAIDVTGENYLAEHNLGVALLTQPARLSEALPHLTTAVRLQPNSAKARTDLGNALSHLPDRLPEAISQLEAAVRLDPNSSVPHTDLGSALWSAGRTAEAITEFQAALRIDPAYPVARDNLNAALASDPTRPANAIAYYESILRAHPGNAEAHNNLGVMLASIGRHSEALEHFRAAVRLKPDYEDALYNLKLAESAPR